MTKDNEIPPEILQGARQAIAALNQVAYGSDEARTVSIETFRESIGELSGTLQEGVELLLERGIRGRTKAEPDKHVTEIIPVDSHHAVQLIGLLPEVRPPVGRFAMRIESSHFPEGEEDRFTSLDMVGAIAPDGQVHVDTNLTVLNKKFVKISSYSEPVRQIVTFARAALPPKR